MDWEARLVAYVELVADWPFMWGIHDCALFAAACCQVMTGVDPAAAARGRYRTARLAVGALGRLHGVRTLAELADAILGPRVAPATAGVGDVVLVESVPGALGGRSTNPAGRACFGRRALAVVVGVDAVAPGPRGLTRTPMAGWLAAWRVGRPTGEAS